MKYYFALSQAKPLFMEGHFCNSLLLVF